MKYTVKPGDTLGKIASTYTIGGSDYAVAIANYNNIANPDLIYPGQIIEIPDNWLKAQNANIVPFSPSVNLPELDSAMKTMAPMPRQETRIFGMRPEMLIIIGIGILLASLLIKK